MTRPATTKQTNKPQTNDTQAKTQTKITNSKQPGHKKTQTSAHNNNTTTNKIKKHKNTKR